MIKKIALLAILAAFAIFISGCVQPEYQFCCYKANATQDDPVCTGLNESDEPQTLPVLECDVENWTCTLEETDSEGKNKIVPICPNVEAVPCNTTCAGVFCGNFFYDPRPPAAGYGNKESHKETDDGDDDEGEEILEEPLGLWQAQCRLQEMDPLFLRQLENTGDLVMDTFRFGMGSSFQDFEDAQYYFPLTDRACYLNPGATVDRYTVYALPGTLCPWNDNRYRCTSNEDIYSLQFYDCALRCSLDEKGYSSTVEPLNPYLSDGITGVTWEGNGNPFEGNPYAYLDGEDNDGDARSPGMMSFGDQYPLTGTVLYGASFGYSHIQPSQNGGFMPLIVYNTQGVSRTENYGLVVPRIGSEFFNSDDVDSRFTYLIFNQDDNDKLAGRDVFITAEEDPHAIYPWLLAHQSVYNYQFRHGHYLMNGSIAGGAEFECSSGADCMSGYCNNFDYKRGACVGVDGQDILCDCSTEGSDVVCMGAGNDWMNSWDKGSADLVEVPTSRSAAVDWGGPGPSGGSGNDHWGWYQVITSIPSRGKVVEVQFKNSDDTPIDGLEDKVPLFVLYLGGPRSLPDYITRSWDYSAGTYYEAVSSDATGAENTRRKGRTSLGMMLNVLNPCMVFPTDTEAPWAEGTSLSFSYPYYTVEEVTQQDSEGNDYTTYTAVRKEYRFCCDGHANCVAQENETPLGYGVSGDIPDNAGDLSTRFIENCMDGFTTDVHVCYNADPVSNPDFTFGQIATWGWKMSHSASGAVNSPLVSAGEGWNLCHVVGEGTTYVNADDAEELECYQWKVGGAKKSGSGDVCLLQAETYLVVEPRRVNVNGEERWAFGNCLLNSNGDDLEVKDYGVCESCGYLTMAKQEITTMNGWESSVYDPDIYDAGQTYGNTYCPDLMISTPYESPSEHHGGVLYYADEGNPDSFYAVEPYGMNGYVRYQYGETWRDDEGLEKCTYPNGYVVFDDLDGEEIPNAQRGLPAVYPNAYYINRKLESMMKRNIQPVIFALDHNLWSDKLPNTGTTDAGDLPPHRTGAMEIGDDGDPRWSTFELFKELYDTRSYLFESVSSYDHDPDAAPSNSVYYNSATTTYYSIGSFLGNTILNEGAAVIVMEITPGYCNDFSCYDSQLFYRQARERSNAIRLLCPNCMTSIAIGYSNFSDERIGKFDMQDRLKEMSLVFFYGEGIQPIDDPSITTSCEDLAACFESGDCPEGFSSNAVCDSIMISDIDVISVNMALTGEDDYCSIEDEEQRFASIVSNMTELGRVTLQRFGKPIIVTDFTIQRSGVAGACWNDANAGRFMTYLGVHASDLSKSGYIGLIYGDWAYSSEGEYMHTQVFGDNSDRYIRDEFFEGTFTAARKFAGHSVMTYYMEVPEKEECECSPCTMADNPNLCNGRYEGTGAKCAGYIPGEYSKWPDNCITQGVCDIDEYHSLGYGNWPIECTITYDNGTIGTKTVYSADVRESPSGFRDVIASIEDPETKEHLTWCFPLTSGTVTYSKSEHHSYDSLPAVFSMTGNTSVQCNPASGLMDSFCGYYPPVMKYQMKCQFKDIESATR